MDSMRSLNKSLPPSPRHRSAKPPEKLLQAFKAAALSVTNLYKTAASDEFQARSQGYQDALDSLLAFLDKESLGLGDGEGWKVRRWATERLEGSPAATGGSDSDDERGETTKRTRSLSPPLEQKPSPEPPEAQTSSLPASPVRIESTLSTVTLSDPETSVLAAGPEIFTFRSSRQYPQDVEMQADSVNVNLSESESQFHGNGTSIVSAIRREGISRSSRTYHRGTNHSHRPNTRSTTSARSLGSGAGSKRRIAFNEYFDLGSLGEGRDCPGGGNKRGRFI